MSRLGDWILRRNNGAGVASGVYIPFGKAISVQAGMIEASLIIFRRAAGGRADFLRISAKK